MPWMSNRPGWDASCCSALSGPDHQVTRANRSRGGHLIYHLAGARPALTRLWPAISPVSGPDTSDGGCRRCHLPGAWDHQDPQHDLEITVRCAVSGAMMRRREGNLPASVTRLVWRRREAAAIHPLPELIH